MNTIIVAGQSKQGKSPFIKAYCDDSNVIVFDVQDEYGLRTKYPGQQPYGLTTDNKQSRSRVIDLDVKKFIELCDSKRNTICVFEEATMFFQGMTGERMRKLLVSKAHTRNVYVLVFHSINSIPPRMMELADWVVLFKTNDNEKNVERKFPNLVQPFNTLKRAPDGTYIKIKVA
jgi:hypothetical protein